MIKFIKKELEIEESLKQLPPINSLINESLGTSSLGMPKIILNKLINLIAS